MHGLFSVESLGIDEGNADSTVSMQSFAVSSMAADAMDFSNFQELADDQEKQSIDTDSMDTGPSSADQLETSAMLIDNNTITDVATFDYNNNSSSNYTIPLLDQITSDMGLSSAVMQNNTLQQGSPIDIVKRRYPGFEPHKILKFSELFAERVTPGSQKKKGMVYNM